MPAPGTGWNLISEPGLLSATRRGSQEVGQARGTCGGYSGYSDDTAIDNVSPPKPRACGGYSEDTQNGA